VKSLDSQGEVQGVYSLQAAVEDYQEVYDKAVEVYYAFEDAQIAELQRSCQELDTPAERFLNVSGLGWGTVGV
jgi:hypothetical protein